MLNLNYGDSMNCKCRCNNSDSYDTLTLPVIREFRVQFRYEHRGIVSYHEVEYDIFMEKQFPRYRLLVGDESARNGQSMISFIRGIFHSHHVSGIDLCKYSSFAIVEVNDKFAVIKNRYEGTSIREQVATIDEKINGLWTRLEPMNHQELIMFHL